MRIIYDTDIDVDVSVWALDVDQWDCFKNRIYEVASQYDCETSIPYPGDYVVCISPGIDLDRDERLNLIEDLNGVLEDWRKDGWPRDCGAIAY